MAKRSKKKLFALSSILIGTSLSSNTAMALSGKPLAVTGENVVAAAQNCSDLTEEQAFNILGDRTDLNNFLAFIRDNSLPLSIHSLMTFMLVNCVNNCDVVDVAPQ